MPLEYWPGSQAAYHPLTVWAVMAEAVQRLDGRSFRSVCAEDIFGPLGMTRTTWGLPPELAGEASGTGYGFTVGVDRDRIDPCGNLGSERQFGHAGFSVAQAWHDPADGFVAVFIVNLALEQSAGDRLFNILSDLVHRSARCASS